MISTSCGTVHQLSHFIHRSNHITTLRNATAVWKRRFVDSFKGEKGYQVTDINTEKTPITSLLWNNRKKLHHRYDGENIQPKIVPIDLVEKIARDSSLVLEYSFSDDPSLRDTYVDARGNILLGKIFEDLDAFAGNIALHHTAGLISMPLHDEQIPSLVTASVDRISLSSPQKILPVSRDN